MTSLDAAAPGRSHKHETLRPKPRNKKDEAKRKRPQTAPAAAVAGGRTARVMRRNSLGHRPMACQIRPHRSSFLVSSFLFILDRAREAAPGAIEPKTPPPPAIRRSDFRPFWALENLFLLYFLDAPARHQQKKLFVVGTAQNQLKPMNKSALVVSRSFPPKRHRKT